MTRLKKRVQIDVKRRGQWYSYELVISANDTDELTPQMARRAVVYLLGEHEYGTVSDGKKAYRVTKSVRLVDPFG